MHDLGFSAERQLKHTTCEALSRIRAQAQGPAAQPRLRHRAVRRGRHQLRHSLEWCVLFWIVRVLQGYAVLEGFAEGLLCIRALKSGVPCSRILKSELNSSNCSRQPALACLETANGP